MFLAMQYLKHMRTDHSGIENSDIENKQLIFENHFSDQNQNTTGNHKLHQTDSQHRKCFG